MLSFLRQSAAGWVAKIFLGLLVASFAVWGVDDIFLSGPSQQVASVGDSKVTPQAFANAFQRAVNRISQERGAPVSTEQARAEGIDQQVLSDLVSRALYLEAANQMGLAVPDDVLAREIRTMDQFKNELGEFERFRFDNLIRDNGYTEKQFLALVRQEMMREQIVRAALGGVRSPKAYTDAIFTYRAESRSADYLVVPDDTVAVPSPSDGQIDKFYNDHPARYTAPEYRAATLVTLSAAALADDIDVSDEDIQAAYEDRSAAFSTPELRDIEQLVFDTEEDAQAARARVEAGEAFIAVGQDLQGKSEDDMLFRGVAAGTLPAPLGPIAFALDAGVISQPIETGFGFTLVRVRTVTPGTVQPLAAVRDQLRAELAADGALDAMYDLMERFEDARGGGTPLDEAAANLGLPVRTIAAISRTGASPDGTVMNDLPGFEATLASLYEIDVDEESDLIETPDGGFVAARLDGVTPSGLKPLDSIRDDVIAAWKAEQRATLLAAEAEKLAARVRANGIAAVAVSLGVDVKITGDLTRYSDGTGLVSATLRQQMFEDGIAKGAVLHGEGRDGYVIAQITSLKNVTADDAKVQVSQLRSQLSRSFAVDLLMAYQTALEDEIGVSLYQATVDAAIGANANGEDGS